MFYGQEQPVDMPVPELYDTGIMQMYLQAVKDQYDKGEKRMEDFISKYGDFTSPFQKDVEAYQNLGMGRINDIYDQLVAQGIDPLRSREGQAVMARAIREAPKDKLNQLRQSAKVGEEYLKAKGELQSKGLFSQQMENYFLKHPFEDWNTTEYGMFDRVSPLQYKDIHSITDDWFKHIDKKYNADLTKKKNDGYDYYTVDENDIRGIIKSNINDFLSSDYGKFYYDQAVKKARILNPNADESKIRSEAMNILNEDIVNRNSDYLKLDKKANEYSLEAYKDKLERARQDRQWAHDKEMKLLDNAIKNGSKSTPTNIMADYLNRGLFLLGGGQDYDNAKLTGDYVIYSKNAKLQLHKNVDAIRGKYKNNISARIESINNLTANQTHSYSALRHMLLDPEKKGKDAKTIMWRGNNYDGIILSKNQQNRLISKTNWAAETVGSGIGHSKWLHSKIAQAYRKKDSKTEYQKSMTVFVPANTRNLATTVKNNGSVIQAVRGNVFVIQENGDITNLGTAYFPVNRTSSVAQTKYSEPNTISSDSSIIPEVDIYESRMEKLMGVKNKNSAILEGIQ